jgi:hypothetical protein
MSKLKCHEVLGTFGFRVTGGRGAHKIGSKICSKISANTCYIWQKISELLHRFVASPFEKRISSGVVTSPHRGGTVHLAIYWDSKRREPKVIHAKLQKALYTPIPPHSMVTDWCRKHKPRFDILGTARAPGRGFGCDLDGNGLSALNRFHSHNLRSLSGTV